ncbi:MAG: hypothetical protein WBL05_08840, partial [Brooklawnia sp.]|uniref:hypothetical protein n=1 Tax=Brooklawnia sp. TaxID=2699740 RepID=UPI003C73C30A
PPPRGRPVRQPLPEDPASQDLRPEVEPDPNRHARAGGMGRRRVFLHASGFKQSPYADTRPAGLPAAQPPRKLWHSSPGSSGQ